MGDELIQGQPTGQSVNVEASASQPGQAADNQPSEKYVTAEQFESFKTELLKASERQTQSLVDKKTDPIIRKVAQLGQAGINATPEQARALLQQESEAQSSVQQPPAAQLEGSQVGGDDTTGTQREPDAYYAAINKISVDTGITIEEGDPEIEMLKDGFPDGVSMVSAYAQAVANKKLRIAQEESNLGSTPALFSGGKKSTIVPTDIPYSDLYSRAYGGK